MATKKQTKIATKKNAHELDTIYLLKLVMYLIVGAQWIRITNYTGSTLLPIPIGLIMGLLFAAHDHFKIDRKIEIAVLVVAMFVGFWNQVGIYISV